MTGELFVLGLLLVVNAVWYRVATNCYDEGYRDALADVIREVKDEHGKLENKKKS